MSTPEEQKVPARKPRPSTAATNLQNLFAGGVLTGRQGAQSGEGQLPDQMNQVLLQAAQSTQGSVNTIQELPGVGTILRVPLDHILDSYYQTREQIDQIKYAQLIHSIKTLGFRQLLFVCRDPEQDDYYLPMMGGHIRKMAAKEAGLTEVPVVLIEYDKMSMGLGTAQENLGRQELNTIEKGNLFIRLRKDFKWSQEKLAAELGIEGIGRDHIAACELAARSAPDIQEMLIVKGDEGFRTASYLRRLDVLDEQEQGRATQVRAPIIQAFLEERITTDGVRVAIERLLKAGEETTEVIKGSIIQRIEQIEATTKRFEKYCRLVGDGPIFEEERKGLLQIQQTIQALLERS
jgi:ParB/RepB/Spo0J family partition protein